MLDVKWVYFCRKTIERSSIIKEPQKFRKSELKRDVQCNSLKKNVKVGGVNLSTVSNCELEIQFGN